MRLKQRPIIFLSHRRHHPHPGSQNTGFSLCLEFLDLQAI